MIKTQIQLPDSLYRRLKNISLQIDLSLAELLRRGAEYIANSYDRPNNDNWEFPIIPTLKFRSSDCSNWREIANRSSKNQK